MTTATSSPSPGVTPTAGECAPWCTPYDGHPNEMICEGLPPYKVLTCRSLPYTSTLPCKSYNDPTTIAEFTTFARRVNGGPEHVCFQVYLDGDKRRLEDVVSVEVSMTPAEARRMAIHLIIAAESLEPTPGSEDERQLVDGAKS